MKGNCPAVCLFIFSLKVSRISGEASDAPSESVLRRRSGWFFQSELAAQHRISEDQGEDGVYFYDIEIVPEFLKKVLNITMSEREWLEALRELPHIAPRLELQPDGSESGLAGMDVDIDMDSMDTAFKPWKFWKQMPKSVHEVE